MCFCAWSQTVGLYYFHTGSQKYLIHLKLATNGRRVTRSPSPQRLIRVPLEHCSNWGQKISEAGKLIAYEQAGENTAQWSFYVCQSVSVTLNTTVTQVMTAGRE
jgi:hypothetical protein